METVFRDEKLYQSVNIPVMNLLPSGGGRLLDCGCGTGETARYLASQGWTVTGITISAEEQRLASEHCERVLLANLEEGLPEDVGDGYDVVLMSHVLEHLRDPTNVLRDAKRVLAPSGVVVVGLPNVLQYPFRLDFLMGKFEYDRYGIMDDTHLRFYTFKTGADLLRSNGFRILTAGSQGSFPLWKVRKILPASVVDRINQWACRWRPGLFGFQHMYVAQPE